MDKRVFDIINDLPERHDSHRRTSRGRTLALIGASAIAALAVIWPAGQNKQRDDSQKLPVPTPVECAFSQETTVVTLAKGEGSDNLALAIDGVSYGIKGCLDEAKDTIQALNGDTIPSGLGDAAIIPERRIDENQYIAGIHGADGGE